MGSNFRIKQRDVLRKSRSRNYSKRTREYSRNFLHVPKATGIVTSTKAAKRVTGVGPRIRMKGSISATKVLYRWKRQRMDPAKIHDYFSIHDCKGDHYAYIYDYNLYSSDGSAWLAYLSYVKDWNLWALTSVDGFLEALPNNYNRCGASSGPNRRYQYCLQRPQPIRPPVGHTKPTLPQIPRFMAPESIFDLDFWGGARRVGPGNMCADPAGSTGGYKYMRSRLHPANVEHE